MNEEIMSALLDWNPWFEKQIPSELTGINRQHDLFSFLEIPEIKILEGVRRSGKSTLLYQLVDHAQKQAKLALYVNFEDSILSKYSLAEIYYTFLEKRTIDYLLIDEIQYCRDWVPFLRKLYDNKAVPQIWITGSNSALIKKEYAELLTGRNLKIPIFLLSFVEYMRFKGLEEAPCSVSRQKEAQIKQYFQSYLNLGAFPAIALRNILQRELLINYFEDFLYKDIATRYNVTISKLKDLALYLITNSTKLFSYRKIAAILHLHANTVNDYVSYMKEAFLLDEICKFDYSLQKQYSNDKKLYVIDTGLANSVSFRFSEDKGRMLETLVFQSLKRQKLSIYFHRNKKECDFLVKSGYEIINAIQVTCSLLDEETREREIAGLVEALSTYNLSSGLILTMDEAAVFEIIDNGTTYQITVKPVWRWLLETD